MSLIEGNTSNLIELFLVGLVVHDELEQVLFMGWCLPDTALHLFFVPFGQENLLVQRLVHEELAYQILDSRASKWILVCVSILFVDLMKIFLAFI